jgi:hypothetical protein
VIKEDTLQRVAHTTRLPDGTRGDFGPLGGETRAARWTVGVTTGVDLALRVGAAVEVVPEFRLHWVYRSKEIAPSQSDYLGLSPWIVRTGIGVRASF